MTLSSMTPPITAFKMGGAWGFTHCIGTTLMFTFLQATRTWFAIDTEKLEYWGNYAIGLLLMSAGFYFKFKEGDFVIEEKNGNMTVRACKCHGGLSAGPGGDDAPYKPPVRYSRRESSGEEQKLKLSLSAAYNQGSCEEEVNGSQMKGQFRWNNPSCEHEESMLAYGTILGFLQGLLCPTC